MSETDGTDYIELPLSPNGVRVEYSRGLHPIRIWDLKTGELLSERYSTRQLAIIQWNKDYDALKAEPNPCRTCGRESESHCDDCGRADGCNGYSPAYELRCLTQHEHCGPHRLGPHCGTSDPMEWCKYQRVHL